MISHSFTWRAAIWAAGLALAAPALAGTITGTVKFEGTPPAMRPIEMTADPVCHAKQEGQEPVNEALVLGEGQTMGNVFVQVVKGLPEGQSYPAPEGPAVLTQEGCIYKPHVFVVRLGQPLKVLNPDGTMHNVNGLPNKNKAFNRGMPKNLEEIELNFDQVEDMFRIKCDVHPWMNAYAAVVDHPFYDVTEKDGVFSIAGLPAGTYEIRAWHERLGEQTAQVEVAEEGEVQQDFSFSR
jgi:plastocyanin